MLLSVFKKMTKKKKIVIWASVIIGMAVCLFWFFGREKNKIEYQTVIASRADVFQTVSVTAELKAEEDVLLNFETSGRVKSVDVFVGKKVARGDVIGMIDDAIFGQQLQQAKSALNQAIAAAGANDDTTREAEQAKENAEEYLEQVKDLEKQKVSAAEQALDDAEDYYDDALSYYNKVVDDDGVDSKSAKSAKLTLGSAETSKHAAEDAVETTKKARDLAILSAENSLKSTKERVKTVESDFTKQSTDSAVENAKAAYNIALMNLDKATLKAPVNGTITETNYSTGEVLGSASIDLSSSASTAFAKMLSSDFILESFVPESDILKLKIGQNSTVTFDAIGSDDELEAEVIEIDPASTVVQDVVYYKVKLRLADIDQRLRAGMSADVEIHTAEKKNVISIPQRAINEEDNKKTVDILLSEEQTKTVEVKTGLRGDEGDVEIISGLSGGEEVVTFRSEGK